MARRVTATDMYGRYTAVLLPDGVPDSDAFMGIPLGPPNLDSLGLPVDIQTRLHNELFVRGIYSLRDSIIARKEILGALLSALRVDTEKIAEAYRTADKG